MLYLELVRKSAVWMTEREMQPLGGHGEWVSDHSDGTRDATVSAASGQVGLVFA